ncbi:polycomb group RING finger protein 3 isoform X2 [Castor canadensis]|uniref:Polycomb group RING finger protein 3 isoform X2 n=1 Tax=Castor canadensis TaxID=51338 RepID=A0AC58K264_CASCN
MCLFLPSWSVSGTFIPCPSLFPRLCRYLPGLEVSPVSRDSWSIQEEPDKQSRMGLQGEPWQASRCSRESRLSFAENGNRARARRKVQKQTRVQSEEGSSHPHGGLKPPCHGVRGDTQTSEEKPKMLTRKIKLWDINAHITCRLCSGYLIDATTVTECLHTFCRSCLVKYLEENNTCPTCRIVIHQSHPLQYIGHDRTMQDIVYKLVPGLQEAEMRKQREFYHKLGMEVPGDIKGEACSTKQHLDPRNGETKADDSSNKETAEEKQEEDNDYHRSDEQVSICLECNSSKLRGLKRKWIRCSAQATVLHLKKFIAKKLNLSSFNELDILCNEEILGKDHTLKFVVVTRWRFKKAPLLLHYRPKMDLL